jgi:aminoglycoside phosphotransferase (APT) family kinase protein
MLPEIRKEAVTRALRGAFGVSEFDDIRKLTAGLSKALVFRIVVRGNPYLLRVIINTDATVGPGQGDQTNHFAAMKMAAQAGIGPRVWYTSTKDGVSITDFVATRPLPRTEALARVPATLRKLHALPPFPAPRVVNYLDGMDKLVRRFQTAGILPESEAAELFEFYGQAMDAYPRDGSDMVSSHNDMRPENVLYDGDRVWLVDWEAAFLNDRYVDLAVVANFVVTNSAAEEAFLRTYFAKAVNEYHHARLYLMGQLLHLFYPAFILLFSCKGRSIDSVTGAPDFRDFHNRIWAGKVNLADDEAKLEYAKVHMNQALQNHRTQRFHEALRIVSIGM